ncbi:MAG: TolC family protein [Aquificaceae bacterium]|nr:TolC family protein [Aquificaceae bacterium]MDW8423159.1 TolC family protein [Aquificaceae bacterium]
MILILFLFSISFALDLKSTIRLTIENSPYIRGLSAERLAYEGKRLSYRSNLNPTMDIEAGNFGTSKESVSKAPIYKVSYSQPVPYPSLFNITKEIYRKQLESLSYRIESEKNKLAQDVYLLFFQALYLQKLLEVLEEEVKIQREIKDFVERSFKLGETTKLEFFRAQRELELLESEKTLTLARYKALLEELSAFTGKEINSLEGELSLPQWKDLNLEDVPLFVHYKASQESLSRLLKAEKILGRPTYSLSLTAEKVSDREYGFRVGVSVSLPIFYARQGEMLEIMSQRELLLAEESSQRLKAIAQLRSAKRHFLEVSRQVQRLEGELIPQAKSELELALKSYRLRTITLLDLSQVRKGYYDLLKRRLELLFQAHVEYAKGIFYGGSSWCGCY